MKIKKSHLKELIRQSIAEIDFKDKESFEKYKAKHKMRGSTKVNIGGKETTVDKASGKKGDIRDKAKKPEDLKNDTQDFLTGKNAEDNIEKLNNLAMDDKPVQFDTDDGRSLTWDDGDYETDVVYALDQDGEEVVISFDDIVRMDADLPKADRGNKALFSDPEPEDDTGGPSYANVPKGAKTSKQAKQMSKIEKDMDKAVNDANEKMAFDQVPSIRIKQITTAEQDVIRHDHIDKTHKALKKAGSNKVDAFKSLGDAYKQAEKDRNEEYYKYYKEDEPPTSKSNKKASKVFQDGIKKQKKVGFQLQKLLGKTNFEFDDIKESKKRRFTVKEVQKWMKTLEENRYKRVYNSDARRVSWMVNNMGENVENMPKSMRKKWTKAQYGRERYLAKEFVKHSYSKELNENKIRKIIKTIIREKLNEVKRRELEIHVRDKTKVDKILKKMRLKPGKDYDIGFGSSRSFMLDINVKYLDKVVTILMKNRINVK